MVVTVQRTDVYKRPPLPYDPVASRVRFAQAPKVAGALITTVGLEGFDGAWVETLAALAVGLLRQKAADSVQNERNNPALRVTLAPGARYMTLVWTLFTTPKEATTADALIHLHDVIAAPTKLNRPVHGQIAVLIPAESVGLLKVTTTSCPLSENLLNSIDGAGIFDNDDSTSTDKLGPVN